MITKDELIQYSRMRKLKNLGQAELDYFQILLLFILYQNYGKELIFKGGTALQKCYGLDRFSEDLDFTTKEKIDIKKCENDLNRFKLEYEIESKPFGSSISFVIRIKGPLYIGTKASSCRLIIDDSVRENVLLRPEIKTIGRFLEEVPTFDVIVMQQKEIYAEKIRAIMSRDKARDVYDLWFLIKNNTEFDKLLINEKLKYYNEVWDFKNFQKMLHKKKDIWAIELKPLIQVVPSFETVTKEIVENIKKDNHN
ncbi:nucleotidyl transferase AbiEii/AbiGii toxin family protein [Candidatus Woesearchaeota archaeon]|nr:nucleotidyl transferase AbiEii/AbiGii toxin family protein [Candidatus Woesearchaeota archaeon]